MSLRSQLCTVFIFDFVVLEDEESSHFTILSASERS